MLIIRKMVSAAALIGFLLVQAACSSKTPLSPTPTVKSSPTKAPTAAPTNTQMPTSTTLPQTTPVDEGLAATAAALTPGSPESTQPAGAGTALPTAAVVATQPAGAVVADKYLYVSQNIPDNTQVKPGTPMTIIWTVKNTGATEWNTNYILRNFSGPKVEKTVISFPKKVAPQASLDLSVNIVAPLAAGTYNTWWKLTNEAGQNFGDVNFIFIVTDTPGAANPTPTP